MPPYRSGAGPHYFSLVLRALLIAAYLLVVGRPLIYGLQHDQHTSLAGKLFSAFLFLLPAWLPAIALLRPVAVAYDDPEGTFRIYYLLFGYRTFPIGAVEGIYRVSRTRPNASVALPTSYLLHLKSGRRIRLSQWNIRGLEDFVGSLQRAGAPGKGEWRRFF